MPLTAATGRWYLCDTYRYEIYVDFGSGASVDLPAMTLSHTHARELKKGSAELLILSLVETRARHGYEIGKLIEQRSDGAITFSAAALYPLLYRLEKRGWIQGRWVEKAGERRRRFYRLTPSGRRILDEQRSTWRAFAAAIDRIAGTGEA